MEHIIRFTRQIKKSEERTYLELPFEVPADTARLDIRYQYQRYEEQAGDEGVVVKEVNIIDLALLSPQGFVGASGSDRRHIWISAADTSRGYMAMPVTEGTWTIIAGAYCVEAAGAEVCYEITLTPKARRLLKGDLHMHTTASDGNLTTAEVMQEAVRCGLDYICITDHNAFSQNDEMASPPAGLTVIPGMELTHYRGHCNLMGVKRPVQNPFGINTREQLRKRLAEAVQSGAAVSVNHPFSDCPWEWGMASTAYDLVEVWNGGTPPDQNMLCLEWWHQELQKGRRLPVVGGSDFHRSEAMRSLGCPATWVYSRSGEQQDILAALRAGHSFITLNHSGPTLEVRAGDGILGDQVSGVGEVEALFGRLQAGDRIRVITDRSAADYLCETAMSSRRLLLPAAGCLFMRFEVYRSAIRQFAEVPCLISNPVYFQNKTVENNND